MSSIPCNSVSEGVVEVGPAGLTLTISSPSSSAAFPDAANSSGFLPHKLRYTLTLSRTGPPSNWCTGAPTCLPRKSQSAISRALIAVLRTGPSRQNLPLCISCVILSIPVISVPETRSHIAFSAGSTSSWRSPIASPHPTSPSLLSNRSKSHLGGHRITLAERIFISSPLFLLIFHC